jgi:hypothetical protein
MSTQSNQTVTQDTTETPKQAPPDLTPYAAAQVVTNKMRAMGDKNFEMAPQTMYGLANRNVIKKVEKPGSKADGSSKIFFDGTDFARWLKGYVTGTGTTSSGRLNYEQLANAYDLDAPQVADDETRRAIVEAAEHEGDEPESDEPQPTEAEADELAELEAEENDNKADEAE